MKRATAGLQTKWITYLAAGSDRYPMIPSKTNVSFCTTHTDRRFAGSTNPRIWAKRSLVMPYQIG